MDFNEQENDLDKLYDHELKYINYSPMASQYLPSTTRQVVNYSPSKQNTGQNVQQQQQQQQQQQPATSMYTTTSGFQTFQTVFTPTYADANGEHTKIEPHDSDGQVRVLMPLYQTASSSATSTMVPVKFVEASGGNSVILSTSNGSYTQNGTVVHQSSHHQPQYQTIQLSNQPHLQHQVVNGQIINTSNGQGQFSSNQVQYIVVQHPANGNGMPVDIKSEIDPSNPDEARRIRDASRKRRRRMTESEEEAAARRLKNLEAKRRRLARETEEERRRRRQRDAEAKRRRRERETEEQRLARLARDSARMRRTRRLKKAQLKGEPLDQVLLELPPLPPPPSKIRQPNSQQGQNQLQSGQIKMEGEGFFPSSSSSLDSINQSIAAVIDNKNNQNQQMVIIDQKPFVSSHGHTIQIPANSMVQTVAMQPGMITIPGQSGQGQVQQIILLPPPGQQGTVTLPAGAQLIQRHADSSASSVSSNFITEQQVQSQQMLPDDPIERQRIRNKERARRRRANETPEQRALRNMKTAERMRRRRAQLAEQRALANGITQQVKVVLTPEEINARFDDLFKAVLERADYEVENDGPIVPKPRLPPRQEQQQYEESAEEQQIFLTETGEFVLEAVNNDEHGNEDQGEHIEIDESNEDHIDIVEYKPNVVVTRDGTEQASNSRDSAVSDDVLQHDQSELDDEHLSQL